MITISHGQGEGQAPMYRRCGVDWPRTRMSNDESIVENSELATESAEAQNDLANTPLRLHLGKDACRHPLQGFYP